MYGYISGNVLFDALPCQTASVGIEDGHFEFCVAVSIPVPDRGIFGIQRVNLEDDGLVGSPADKGHTVYIRHTCGDHNAAYARAVSESIVDGSDSIGESHARQSGATRKHTIR